jgi:hypothetical protein
LKSSCAGLSRVSTSLVLGARRRGWPGQARPRRNRSADSSGFAAAQFSPRQPFIEDRSTRLLLLQQIYNKVLVPVDVSAGQRPIDGSLDLLQRTDRVEPAYACSACLVGLLSGLRNCLNTIAHSLADADAAILRYDYDNSAVDAEPGLGAVQRGWHQAGALLLASWADSAPVYHRVCDMVIPIKVESTSAMDTGLHPA